MARVLILSSHVAASPVGGSAQVVALARQRRSTRCWFRRCCSGGIRGLGPPGGGPVADRDLRGHAARRSGGGRAGEGSTPSSPAISRAPIRSRRRPGRSTPCAPPTPTARIVVDPIMGDHPKGLYVREEVALMIARRSRPARRPRGAERLGADAAHRRSPIRRSARRPRARSAGPSWCRRSTGAMETSGWSTLTVHQAWLASHRAESTMRRTGPVIGSPHCSSAALILGRSPQRKP